MKKFYLIKQFLILAFTICTSNSLLQAQTTTCWRSIGDGISNSVYAITGNGKLYAWGLNSFGQLGIGDGRTTNINVPVQIGADSNWLAISASTTHVLALKADGTLWVCGLSGSGGLGLGNVITSVKTFTQIGTDADWKMITTGQNISAAIKKDGTLWTWGINTSGQMGDGTSVNKFVPTQIGTDNDWKLVSGGSLSGNIFALKNNGTLWFAGPNSYFHSGDNTLNASSVKTSFTQVGTDTDWVHAQSGYFTAMAKKANGTYYLWGTNQNGQLGNGTTTSVLTPTRLFDTTASPWVNVYLGAYLTWGLKADSTLWAWGTNTYGSYGNGTTVTPAGKKPVLVQSGVTWRQLAGGLHVLAIKGDGSLWLWGFNTSGQVGNGTFNNQLTPIASPISTPCNTTLPVIVASFTATNVSNTAVLNWVTASEINSKNFEVQRSIDGVNFTTIATINAEGNSASTKNYLYTDVSPFAGSNYYRLKQVDKDGSYQYSEVKTINIAVSSTIVVNVYPNPAKEFITVQVQKLNGTANVELVDVLGKSVIKQALKAGTNLINVTHLQKGIYIINVVTNEERISKKIVIE